MEFMIEKQIYRRFLALFMTGFLVLITGVLTMLPSKAQAADGTMVVFTANWCAACREVLPVVRQVAAQNGVSIAEVDVDASAAPKEAKRYSLEIPARDLPQVYLYESGRTRLLFDGAGYRWGQTSAVRSKLLDSLQSSR